MINITIHNYLVKRVLFDNDGGVDIYYAAAKMMGIMDDQLRLYPKPLIGFRGHSIIPKGVITLLLTLGEKPRKMNAMTEFVVIDASSAYNAILGRPSKNSLRIIRSSPHLKVKFPTPNEIRELKGNRSTLRECYNTSQTKKEKGEGVIMENLDARNEL